MVKFPTLWKEQSRVAGDRDGEKFSKSVSCPVLEKAYSSVWGLKAFSFRRWGVVLAIDRQQVA